MSLPDCPVPFSEHQLRDALGQFATGVTIVTTVDAAGQPVGMTVSSFNAVSLNPPLVLWSLGRATSLYPVFASCQHYAIHVLALEQAALADQLRRASKSICANLAEGFGKQAQSKAEFKRFILMSIGSADEMRVWIRYCVDLGYIDEATWQRWRDEQPIDIEAGQCRRA